MPIERIQFFKRYEKWWCGGSDGGGMKRNIIQKKKGATGFIANFYSTFINKKKEKFVDIVVCVVRLLLLSG